MRILGTAPSFALLLIGAPAGKLSYIIGVIIHRFASLHAVVITRIM